MAKKKTTTPRPSWRTKPVDEEIADAQLNVRLSSAELAAIRKVADERRITLRRLVVESVLGPDED